MLTKLNLEEEQNVASLWLASEIRMLFLLHRKFETLQ